MIQVASTTASMFNELAHTALTMLGGKSSAHEAKAHNGHTSLPLTNGNGNAEAALLPGAALLNPLSGITISDWDYLFRAVEARLKMAVGDGLVQTADSQGNYSASLVQASVLDCVKALDQLHVALALERDRFHQLELETIEAKTAHARTLAELVRNQSQ